MNTKTFLINLAANAFGILVVALLVEWLGNDSLIRFLHSWTTVAAGGFVAVGISLLKPIKWL